MADDLDAKTEQIKELILSHNQSLAELSLVKRELDAHAARAEMHQKRCQESEDLVESLQRRLNGILDNEGKDKDTSARFKSQWQAAEGRAKAAETLSMACEERAIKAEAEVRRLLEERSREKEEERDERERISNLCKKVDEAPPRITDGTKLSKDVDEEELHQRERSPSRSRAMSQRQLQLDGDTMRQYRISRMNLAVLSLQKLDQGRTFRLIKFNYTYYLTCKGTSNPKHILLDQDARSSGTSNVVKAGDELPPIAEKVIDTAPNTTGKAGSNLSLAVEERANLDRHFDVQRTSADEAVKPLASYSSPVETDGQSHDIVTRERRSSSESHDVYSNVSKSSR